MTDALVIGAGPAGLMAAETMAAAGMAVTIVDAMPSVGRKFLMAGKSGLNLTKNEEIGVFLSAFGQLSNCLETALRDFGPEQVITWAEGLGQPLFTGSTGRVFPKAMKASPLLRAWMARLDRLGVTLKTRWRWTGFDGVGPIFETPDGQVTVQSDRIVLALGGASWARLGSNGAWAAYLPTSVAPFAPANMGFRVKWSNHMAAHLGKPVKSIKLIAGDVASRGEIVISKDGIEGGGIYSVSKPMRNGVPLTLDLLPDWSMERVQSALKKPQGKTSLSNHLRKTLKLDAAQIALLSEFGRPFPNGLARLIKALPIVHDGPQPIDQAISTAGGVRFDAMDGFMLRDRPNIFCAGEMLDWEAPTGGYLITACLATGRAAGQQALG